MKKEVYEAMKTRLKVKEIRLHVWYVTFLASDDELNRGYDCFQPGWIDSIGMEVRDKPFNLWNVAQHFHKLLKGWAPDDLDERLIAHPLHKN